MVMDTTFATLACCLLALSFPAAQTQDNSTITSKITPDLNLTHTTATVTPSKSTVNVTVISNSTENTTPFTGTTRYNETLTNATAATTESTSRLQTPQSTTITAPLTNSTSATTTTPGTHTPTFTAPTTPGIQTTGNISAPDTTVITPANSSHTVNTTSASVDTSTKGLGLNISEENMTIIFSVVLGVFTLSLVAIMFHKCKQKIQYLHQPLNNTDEPADAFVADDDTLVISGGLYDGHPIYDNVPPAQEDQSQFRLEFLR